MSREEQAQAQRRALQTLAAQPAPQVLLCAKTITTIARNILDYPHDPKFRALKPTNKALQKSLFCTQGGVDLLLAVGFQTTEQELVTLSPDANLQPIRNLVIAMEAVVAHITSSQIDPSACGKKIAKKARRVCGAHGWVVHGFLIEFDDASRSGVLMENDGSLLGIDNDEVITRRGGTWHLVHPNEDILLVQGHDSKMGYLCGSITVTLSSRRCITIAGNNTSMYGSEFQHVVPSDDSVAEVRFAYGRCVGLTLCSQQDVVTEPSSLPCTSGNPSNRPAPRTLGNSSKLLQWRPLGASKVRSPTAPRAALKSRPRVLHCHDMKGGYCAAADEDYISTFGGWDAIDVFVYFAHERVSMPPELWVNECHSRGIPCLGTLIVEGNTEEALRLLASPSHCASCLASLADHYGFDGFLVNLEAPIPQSTVPLLVDLLGEMKSALRARVGAQSLVIYYDAVDVTGGVRYQNALTLANFDFFEACDGIFTNYWWSPSSLAASAALAGPHRAFDVYAGVDIFARGPVGYAAGTGCRDHCLAAKSAGLSLALFAPGWSLECGEARGKPTHEAAECDRRFWDELEIKKVFRSG